MSTTTKHDKEDIQRVIRDMVSLLCRSSLSPVVGVRIQGLIGITVDDSQVLLVQFDDSFASDHLQQPSVNGSSVPVSATAPELCKSNARKRLRMSETALPPAAVSGTQSAEPSAGINADCDVIVITDELDDHDVKFDFGQFCNSADESHIGPVTDISMFKSEDPLSNTNISIYAHSGDGFASEATIHRGSARKTLLRDMLATPNDYTSDNAQDWQSASSYSAPVQTDSVRSVQMKARPRIKQVLVLLLIQVRYHPVAQQINGDKPTCESFCRQQLTLGMLMMLCLFSTQKFVCILM